MKSRLFSPILILLVMMLGATLACAQEAIPEPFQWSARIEPENVHPGQNAVIQITLQLAEEHFIYKDMTSFEVEAIEGIQPGAPVFPKPENILDPFDGKPKDVYKETVVFTIPLTTNDTLSSGTRELNIAIHYQGCNEEVCFLPRRVMASAVLSLSESDPDSALPGVVAPSESGWQSLDDAEQEAPAVPGFLSRGKFWAFLIVFFGGILTSFTPCVYPLIPITISLFGARESSNRLKSFLLSATYVLGIATMYSLMGLGAAATGAVFGQFMTNRLLVSIIALVFIAFGASMLGLFEIHLPSSLQQKISRTGGKGFGGAFVMGLFGGIIAAPCTGPALGAVLAYVATTRDLFLGFWLLFTFALGLGMLFLILGTFSELINRIPKSGSWMDGVKSVFAIILFAFALYFARDAFPILRSFLAYSPGYFLAAVVMLILGIFLGGVHKTFYDPSQKVRWAKGAGVALMSLGLFVGMGSLTATSYESLPKPDWVKSEEEGLRLGQQLGKPVMIDFYADWCVACVKLNRYTFSNEAVLETLEDFIAVKVDFTRDSPEKDRLVEKYGIVGLPTIVFYDAEGNLRQDKTLLGFINAENFRRHIEELIS